MSRQADSSITRLQRADGTVVGAGFLVDIRQVMTCAHVVAAALNMRQTPPDLPTEMLHLDFPLVAPGQMCTAHVVQPWLPDLDIAVLELAADPPQGTKIIRLARVEDDLYGHEFQTFGFPAGIDDGEYATGRILGRQARGWLHVEDTKVAGRRVEPGFSGSPVWDVQLDGGIGMVVASDRDPAVKVAFVIPVDVLIEAWPRLEDLTLRFVFVSYSRLDSEFVNRLHSDLQQRGISIWIDQLGLVPGTQDWDEAIRKAIRSARAVLYIASPNARQSRYSRDELEVAEMYGRVVCPVWALGDDDKRMDSFPLGWGAVQGIDARGARYDAAVDEIVRILEEPSETHPGWQAAKAKTLETRAVLRNPYKGLHSFTNQDVDDFFGREQLTTKLVKALGAQLRASAPRLLAIVGASGSGKSSVVMAGVLPRLQQGELPNSEKWVYLPRMVPGTAPIENLAIVLSSALGQGSIAAIQTDVSDPNARGLHQRAKQLVSGSDRRVVLFVDQFEELFTATKDPALVQQLITLLDTACREPDGPTIVVLTMRADFYDRLMVQPALVGFAQLMGNHHQVLPMTFDELRDAIQRPAQNVGLHLDDDLVGDLLFGLRGQVGALPMLQFTLDQLFQRRDGTRLTIDAYRDILGVRGALANYAEETYKALPSDTHRELARPDGALLKVRWTCPIRSKRRCWPKSSTYLTTPGCSLSIRLAIRRPLKSATKH